MGEHIFGVVLMNDWSARDIQRWEYVPLGPFGAKNWGTTISPWVVTLEALEPFRKQGASQTEPPLLPYLQDEKAGHYDVKLEVSITTAKQTTPHTLTSTNLYHMYYSMKQQPVHHAVTGCNMQPGDLLASGTISGPEKSSFGSLLELTWKGTEPITLPSGETRKFIEDGDTIVMSGYCEHPTEGYRIGFGSASGTLLPAHDQK